MPKINIHSINFNGSLLNTEFLDTTKKFTSHELTKHEKLLLLLKANSKLIKHIKSKQKSTFDESILVSGSSYQDHNSNCMCYENTGYSSFHLLPGIAQFIGLKFSNFILADFYKQNFQPASSFKESINAGIQNIPAFAKALHLVTQ